MAPEDEEILFGKAEEPCPLDKVLDNLAAPGDSISPAVILDEMIAVRQKYYSETDDIAKLALAETFVELCDILSNYVAENERIP